MEVVVPLGGQAVAAALPRGDQPWVVEIRLGNQRQRPAQGRAQDPGLDREVLEDVDGTIVLQRVHRVQPKPVHVEVAEPHRRVVEDVAPHLVVALGVKVDRRTPGIRPALDQVGAEPRQVVPKRSQVVVDNVLDDRETALVAGVDEPLVATRPRRTSSCTVYRQHAVVAPVVMASKAFTGGELDAEVDAELHQVVEPPMAGTRVPSRVKVPTCSS